MILGATTYCIFIANFLYPTGPGLYIVSVVIGVGAAIIWTGQGNFLTINSNPDTIARNSGVFWALLQCSLLFGNLFVYFEFRGETRITKSTRLVVYGVLTGVGILGGLLLLVLRTPSRRHSADISTSQDERSSSGPMQALVKSFRLIKTRKMILLCVTFFYTGLELSFFSGVYGTAIGSTKSLGSDAQKLIGISGMLIGAGEIIGGATFGLLGSKTTKKGRDPVVMLGFVVHMISFLLIYINLPNAASIQDTDSSGYITSNVGIALFCSFLLGFGDSCFNTQIYSILGSIYADDSAPAFALFKFVQSIATAIAFLYSKSVGLHSHVYILAVFAVLGTASFCKLEWESFKEDLPKAKTSPASSPQNSSGDSTAPLNQI
jgi:MFS family permease